VGVTAPRAISAQQVPDALGQGDAQRLPRLDQGDDALATAKKELFENNVLAESLLDKLGQQVTLLEVATQASYAGPRNHTGARAELGAVAGEIVEIVQVFDGLNRYQFRADPKL
jgi:hypothetical protein